MSDESAASARVSEIVAAHQGMEGPLLPVLHAVQAALGHVPQAAVPVLAEGLGLTRAEVRGVVSFYHDFREVPAGRHVVRLCRAEACQAMGGADLAQQVKARLGLDWHQTSADGAVTLEPVFCLGLCACAPAAQLDGRLVGRLDEAKLAALLDEVRR
ncbi:MAG: formate dehydrogenase subunit gamma [Rhodobacteraceae bacterium]|nr:formate dehydrogenase subunit gamma [Paracoccaceae bacterium]